MANAPKPHEEREPGRKELDHVNVSIWPFWNARGIGTAYDEILANGRKQKLSAKEALKREAVLKEGGRYLKRGLLIQILTALVLLYFLWWR